jgi:8-amino-7-oxononanoate synthase
MTMPYSNHEELRRSNAYFGGCDYLGLSQDKSVKLAVMQAIKTYGISVGAARLTSGTCTAHLEVEALLADAVGTQGAILFSSGYLANIAVTQLLNPECKVFLCMREAHPSFVNSINDLSMQIFASYPALIEAAVEMEHSGICYCLYIDTINSVTGRRAPVQQIKAVMKHGYLILDESHAFGLSIPHQFERVPDNVIVTSSLSKVIGLHGGFIAASENILRRVIQRSAAFRYATPLPPAICRGIARSIWLCRSGQHGEKLRANIRQLAEIAPDPIPWDERASPIHCIDTVHGQDALSIHKHLLNKGIFVPYIEEYGYGQRLLRIAIRANHTQVEIDQLGYALLNV